MEAGTPAIDVEVRSATSVEAIEVTLAYPARHELWNSDGSTSPGAQEALRAELLNRDGWVSATDPLVRNRKTRLVEYEHEHMARPVEDSIPEWANGLAFALNKKRRVAEYGAGSTLAVYGYGLSGDFEPPRRQIHFETILSAIPPMSFDNGFDRTFVFGWHEGWCREFNAQSRA